MSKENFPKGWHSRQQFTDPDTGDYYEKGKLIRQGNIRNMNDIPDEPIVQPPVQTPPAQKPVHEPKNEQDSERIKELELRLEEMRTAIMLMQKVPSNVNVRTEEKPFGEYSDEGIPPDDFLEKSIPYIIYGRGYVMGSYYKNGKLIKAPHNIPVYFNREFDEVTYHDGNAKIMPFSRFTCNSRADSKFIENSDLYGILIFKEYERARNVDAERIDKYESAIYSVQRMDDQKIMATCVAKGIDIRQPKENLKSQLIRVLIKEYMDAEEQLTGSRQEDMKKEVMSPPTL